MAAPNAVIGMTVCWFAHGDRSNVPVAAIVTNTNGNGVLELARIGRGRDSLASVTGVHHVDERQWFLDHPDLAGDKGGWDHLVPEYKAKDPRPLKSPINKVPLQPTEG